MADHGTEPIPGPPGLPILGNLLDIDASRPIQSTCELAEKYGDIIKLSFPGGRSAVVVSSHALVNECCDESRFGKVLSSTLLEVRHGVHDGLFTARKEEPNWGKAHRILTPAFGPLSIRTMFDEMHDIASQLALKWARHGPEEAIAVTEDLTRLTLDTLALCAMGFRFNSFYRSEMHPFVNAMGGFLVESGNRSRRMPLLSMLYRSTAEKYKADIAVLRDTADGVLKARRELDSPSPRKDLLAAMLNGRDPLTGETLSDDAIANNLITFLIAGHETTSGLLSYTFYNLLRFPETMKLAQQEVDEVVGTGPVTPDHMPKLRYLAAALRETARICPAIPGFAVGPQKDELIGGKYFVPKGQMILLLSMRSHFDPVVFGEDAKIFKPERMLDENFERLNNEFPNCWKPFGNGARACIGRPFAWQESLLVLAIMLQNFTFRFNDEKYELQIQETLTTKPKGFFMHAELRHNLTPTSLERRLAGAYTSEETAQKKKQGSESRQQQQSTASVPLTAKGVPLNIYYGSNSGTCEAMAERLASDAANHGFLVDVLQPLDKATKALPKDRPVVIIAASYEGQPTDNAVDFVRWIKAESEKKDSDGKADSVLDGVSYAVFGCGNHDWTRTFHRIPKLLDSALEACGGSRLVPIGLADAAEGNVFEDFESWEDAVLFPALRSRYDVGPGSDGRDPDGQERDADSAVCGLDVEVTTPRTAALRQDVHEAQVVATRVLTSDKDADNTLKRHMEIQLPEGMTYRAGDYLAVLPFNSQAIVGRALRRFHLPWDAHITIQTPAGSAPVTTQANLPMDREMPAVEVLGAYYELAQPATKRGISVLIEATAQAETKEELRRLSTDSNRHISILELLERFPDINLSFGSFLTLLPPIRVRPYSISSSPLWNPSRVSLTYSVLSEPALSGQGLFEGVASSYLARAVAGDAIHVVVRPSHNAFHLPQGVEAAANTPIILVAAGAGIAPFRGFVQERAALKATGRQLAPAMLFLGCRRPSDDLYREELDAWEAAGVVDVRRAYSRVSEDASSEGLGEDTLSAECKYVQDRLWHDRADVLPLWKAGGFVFVCGSRRIGAAVKVAALRMRQEVKTSEGIHETEAESAAWFESMRNVRYMADVFD